MLKPDCEVRSLTGGQQLESALRQAPRSAGRGAGEGVLANMAEVGVARSWLPPLAVAGYPHWPGW